MPPPMDFNELLKIAEKKQHEPIVIETKPKVEEPERLMTKKQMKEYAKEKEWRERKEQRNKVNNSNSKEGTISTSKPNKTQDPGGITNQINKNPKAIELPVLNKTLTKTPNVVQSPIPKKMVEKSTENKLNSNRVNNSKISERDIILEERKKLESEKRKLEEMRQAIEEEKKKLKLTKTKLVDTKNVKPEKPAPKPKVLEKQLPSTSMKQKEISTTNAVKPRPIQMSNEKVKQFPPADLKPIKSKQLVPSRDQKKG